jgi:cob(I)alamin adenosyltransferase
MMIGYVQVYTGDGKGKTTAALGLALRAAGAGLKVFIGQFLKSGETSEIKALKRLSDRITVEHYGRPHFVRGVPEAEDIRAARQGLERIKKVLAEGRYHVVILEEANVAVKYGLLRCEDVLHLIQTKPRETELVITGRDAPPEIIDRADLVTEMTEIKHYFHQGVPARIGIEK